MDVGADEMPGAGATLTLALAGDTMLGRLVARRLLEPDRRPLFSDELVSIVRTADLFVVNLECAISDRGSRWPDPTKPFFFRAPPAAAEELASLGVDCVTLANNHALDYGPEALLDTLARLDRVGIETVGAGADLRAARRPAVLAANGTTLAVIGFTDHPADYAAGPGRPGVAFADLWRGRTEWPRSAIAGIDTDIVLATPHWGPNMVTAPVPHVRRAARELQDAGATVIAGHSAHVFHGIADRVLFDLGDFIDDYAVDERLRNDLGLLFLVVFESTRPKRVEMIPLSLEFCHTGLADAGGAAWIERRLRAACSEFDTPVSRSGRRLVVEW